MPIKSKRSTRSKKVTPVKRGATPLSQRIRKLMLRSIIVGDLQPGEFLSEAVLAKRFSASRTPIREACIHLYQEGLLRLVPGKGYVVSEISIEEVQELDQLRMILEPEFAALAASNPRASEFVADCYRILDRYEQVASESKTLEPYLEVCRLERDFHVAIARASGNRKGAKFMSEIMNQYQRFFYNHYCMRDHHAVESFEEHRETVKAIEARDPVLARRSMYEHLLGALSCNLRMFSGMPDIGAIEDRSMSSLTFEGLSPRGVEAGQVGGAGKTQLTAPEQKADDSQGESSPHSLPTD